MHHPSILLTTLFATAALGAFIPPPPLPKSCGVLNYNVPQDMRVGDCFAIEGPVNSYMVWDICGCAFYR